MEFVIVKGACNDLFSSCKIHLSSLKSRISTLGCLSLEEFKCLDYVLLMHRFAAPLARFGNGLLESLGQTINIYHVIAIDRPGLRFLFRRLWLAIDDNTNTLPIGEKFFFDACQIFPAYLDDFSVAATLHQCFLLQGNSEWNWSNNTQENDEAGD